ncbi:hypothetical protein SVAN01_09950 [Stagonosporopsis vannaccii]|nr:hypothetical protein SVAN01_09950 [Stagonosporopsis vannaccii]
MLRRILWPQSTTNVQAETNSIPSESGIAFDSTDTSYKATICSKPTGATCIEALPLGIQMTLVYEIASREQLAEEQKRDVGDLFESSRTNFLSPTASPIDHGFYLTEERTVTALKPTMLLVQPRDDETILKTKNLLQVLEGLGMGKELVRSLALRFLPSTQDTCDYCSTSSALTFSTVDVSSLSHCFNFVDLFNSTANAGRNDETADESKGVLHSRQNNTAFDPSTNYSRILHYQHVPSPQSDEDEPGHHDDRKLTLYGGRDCSKARRRLQGRRRRGLDSAAGGRRSEGVVLCLMGT